MDSIIFNGTTYRRYDHIYLVSECGQFLRNLEPYKPHQMASGYLTVGRRRLAHRVVASCWCPKPEGATDVHHINENRADNRAANLVWLTTAEHIAMHPNTGKQPMGEEAKSKLRASRLGVKVSDETKAKQREASLRLGLKPPPRKIGTKMGPDFSSRMREVSQCRQACVVNGVRYSSFQTASEATGVKRGTLRKRCLSDNFPDYRLGEKSI